ncbi:hypothetical protein EVAR_32468_1 [Eumeta japonica]|uniref:Uncharacterized protein n=1 Tax=Eumeta variegata TaxID=151549 RepID=A0A4C1VNT9_EUMVA|nr:hypothetical protein EVAR_32468_1 [Eumeta japonica]
MKNRVAYTTQNVVLNSECSPQSAQTRKTFAFTSRGSAFITGLDQLTLIKTCRQPASSLSHPFSVRYQILKQWTGNTPVTPISLRVSMVDDDSLLSGGEYTCLPLENAIKGGTKSDPDYG